MFNWLMQYILSNEKKYEQYIDLKIQYLHLAYDLESTAIINF